MSENELEEKLMQLDEMQSLCTYCSLCSEGCATFQATGFEHDSPRGRLYLAHQFLHGKIDPTSPTLSTFDRCLGCRACESFCPHQVSYEKIRQIVQTVRQKFEAFSPPLMSRFQYKKWINLASQSYPSWWRKWLGKRAKNNEEIPSLSVCFLQYRFQKAILEKALAWMNKFGFPLRFDYKQPCCGAVFQRLIHGEEGISYPKEKRRAAYLQSKAFKAFLEWKTEQTFFLEKSCECFVSQSVKVLDIYAWIVKILEQKKMVLHLPYQISVYYQPYCQSNKGNQDSLYLLLKGIEGLTVRLIPQSSSCCGGYGGEMLLHEEHARLLVEQKLFHVPFGALLVVASLECFELFKKYGEKKNITVLYSFDLFHQCEIKEKS